MEGVLKGHLEPADAGAEPERCGGQQLGVPTPAGHLSRLGERGARTGQISGGHSGLAAPDQQVANSVVVGLAGTEQLDRPRVPPRRILVGEHGETGLGRPYGQLGGVLAV